MGTVGFSGADGGIAVFPGVPGGGGGGAVVIVEQWTGLESQIKQTSGTLGQETELIRFSWGALTAVWLAGLTDV